MVNKKKPKMTVPGLSFWEEAYMSNGWRLH
jgi:hypothetical protein